MKIAILVGGLPPLYNGGTEIATTKIAEYAAKAGHEVHVIAADGTMQRKNQYKELEKGYKVHRIATIPPRYLHGVSFIPEAIKIILELNLDLVHAQAVYTAPSAYTANKIKGIPYLVYERGGIYINYFMAKSIRKLFFGDADRVVAQTEHQKVEILKYAKRKVEVIPNGIDIERFGQLSKKEARKKLGLPLDKKIVLSVARFRPEKNLKCFIDAAMLNSEYLYIMIGDGQQLNELKEYTRNCSNILFKGLVLNEYIPNYLCAADVFVNTSFSEGFPVSILEAMAAGLPVVAPRICGVPEIVADGINGYLTRPNDYQHTAQSIEFILSNDDVLDRISRNNKSKARVFTWNNVVKELYG